MWRCFPLARHHWASGPSAGPLDNGWTFWRYLGHISAVPSFLALEHNSHSWWREAEGYGVTRSKDMCQCVNMWTRRIQHATWRGLFSEQVENPNIPRKVQADFAVGIFIDVVFQHVQSLDLHQKVARLVLGIVGHVVGHDLLHKFQKHLLLSLVIFLHLLPLFSHLTSQMPGDRQKGGAVNRVCPNIQVQSQFVVLIIIQISFKKQKNKKHTNKYICFCFVYNAVLPNANEHSMDSLMMRCQVLPYLTYSCPQEASSSWEPKRRYFRHSLSPLMVMASTDTTSAQNRYENKRINIRNSFNRIALFALVFKTISVWKSLGLDCFTHYCACFEICSYSDSSNKTKKPWI